MVKSISEQKMAFAAYSTESDLPALTARQLELTEKIIAVLSPIDEITNSVYSSSVSVSVIIPFVTMLDKTLKKYHDDLKIQCSAVQVNRQKLGKILIKEMEKEKVKSDIEVTHQNVQIERLLKFRKALMK